jgi:DNA-binding transcriptional ArsR family regulator
VLEHQRLSGAINVSQLRGNYAKKSRVNKPEVAREHVTYGESNGVKVGNSLRKLVLIKLADNANDKGECWPSYQHIADQCECSRTAVRNHIDALEEMGLIKRENRVGVNNGKGNTSNVYYLKLDATPMPLNGTGVCHDEAPYAIRWHTPVPPDGTEPVTLLNQSMNLTLSLGAKVL